MNVQEAMTAIFDNRARPIIQAPRKMEGMGSPDTSYDPISRTYEKGIYNIPQHDGKGTNESFGKELCRRKIQGAIGH